MAQKAPRIFVKMLFICRNWNNTLGWETTPYEAVVFYLVYGFKVAIIQFQVWTQVGEGKYVHFVAGRNFYHIVNVLCRCFPIDLLRFDEDGDFRNVAQGQSRILVVAKFDAVSNYSTYGLHLRQHTCIFGRMWYTRDMNLTSWFVWWMPIIPRHIRRGSAGWVQPSIRTSASNALSWIFRFNWPDYRI